MSCYQRSMSEHRHHHHEYLVTVEAPWEDADMVLENQAMAS